MRPHLNRWDIGLPLAIGMLATVELIGLNPAGLPGAILVEWFAVACLVFRRHRPVTAGLAASAAIVALPLLGPALDEPAVPILIIWTAGYAAAHYRDDLLGLVVPTLTFAVVLLATAVEGPAPDISDVVFTAVIAFPPYVAGRLVRAMLDRNRLLAQEAELIAASREAAMGEAVAAERARMSRELHDVIAHSLSVMTVQAAAAEGLVGTDPDAAMRALRTVQEAGRGALAETSQLLRLLRDTDDELGLAPERGIGDVAELVQEFRLSGLGVDLAVTGALDGLSPMVASSGYRVVRELLTNALRYAPDRQVELRVDRMPEELRITAVNAVDADTSVGSGVGSGLGLVGVGERVAVHGGLLTHGRDGDRFTVSASIPLLGANA